MESRFSFETILYSAQNLTFKSNKTYVIYGANP